jgi:hypothetical protein
MTTELATTNGGHSELAAPRTIREAMQIGQIFAASGLFQDVRGEAQAIVKIMAGAEIGLAPFQAMNALHIIQGKPTMSANTVAMLLKRSGRYNYKVVEWTEQICTLEFFERGESLGAVSFSMADAQKAQLTKNPMWQKYPKPMLFSRCVTMGARAFAADVFGGAIYTPEEMGAEIDGEGNVLSVPDAPESQPLPIGDGASAEALQHYETRRQHALTLGLQPTGALSGDVPKAKLQKRLTLLEEMIADQEKLNAKGTLAENDDEFSNTADEYGDAVEGELMPVDA